MLLNIFSIMLSFETMTLTEYKQKYGISALRELAQKLGTSYPYLYQMETGRRAVTPEMACELEVATSGLLTRVALRPDVFGSLEERFNESSTKGKQNKNTSNSMLR